MKITMKRKVLLEEIPKVVGGLSANIGAY